MPGYTFTVTAERESARDIDEKMCCVHETSFSSTTECDVDMQKDLHRNTLLSRVTTMFTGINTRLEKMIQLAPQTMKIKAITLPERKCSVTLCISVFIRILVPPPHLKSLFFIPFGSLFFLASHKRVQSQLFPDFQEV